MGRLVKATVSGTPRVLDLLALPQVTITTTAGAPILNREDYVSGSITITGAQPYSGTLQIRGRGNSTWDADKKPYRLKLTSAAALLDMPSERDWVLLANYFDPSAIRNAIAMEIGRRCTGLAWTPRFRHVEVVLNGVLLGLYQLGEHVEISRPNKINVTAASGTSGLTLTGAYTLEIDRRYIDNGDPGFTTSRDVMIAYDDPDGTTTEHAAYISGHIQAFEDVLYGGSWQDPTTGWQRYLDLPSWIDWYLVNELCSNQDSYFYSSCKLYKQRDPDGSTLGKLVMGPVWDFDLSLHNNAFGLDDLPPTLFWTKNAPWYTRLFGDSTFTTALRTRWDTLKASLLTGDPIDTFIDHHAALVDYAGRRDRGLWAYTETVATEAADIKAWLADRITWLDANFPA